MASSWYYSSDGGKTKLGPVTSPQLRVLAVKGDISPTDLVWKAGFSKWEPATKIKNLFAPATSVELRTIHNRSTQPAENAAPVASETVCNIPGPPRGSEAKSFHNGGAQVPNAEKPGSKNDDESHDGDTLPSLATEDSIADADWV